MGQCLVKCTAHGDFAVASVRDSNLEGAAFRLRETDGPLSREEQAIDELLGPIFQLALEARFGYQLCLHVFTSLTRVARQCLTERPDGPTIEVRLMRLREVAWGVEELLDNFSSRGWLLRLLCTNRLDALVKWRLNDLSELASEFVPWVPDGAAAVAENYGSRGGASLVPTEEAEGTRQLAAGLRNARRLQEALAAHLPSVMAPHGGAGDPSAMDAFMRRITPLVQRGDEPLRQLELQEEVQIAVASLSVGPHRALRHPDLQYFWWRHMAGLEEVPWSTLWPHLATFLGNTPRLSDGAGDTGAALELLRSPKMVRQLQAVVHRMGYANYVNAAELDMAFGCGHGHGDCSTLEEQLRHLLAPGRPILLARTSKGARAEGWVHDAAAAAAEWQSVTASAAAALEAVAKVAGALVPRQASAGGAADEEAWFDAGSNFSRSNSSGFMSVLAGGDDGSGIWPGRMYASRQASQVTLVAGTSDSPRPLQISRAASAACAIGLGPAGHRSRRSSANLLRHKATSGDDGTGDADGDPAGLISRGNAEAAARASKTEGSAKGAGTSGAPVLADAGAGSNGGRLCSNVVPIGEIEPCDQPGAEPGSQQEQKQPEQEPARGDGPVAAQWPAAPGLARLVGRDEDISHIVEAVLSCHLSEPSAADGAAVVPPLLLVAGPLGCGRTALVTAAADRLVGSGAWTCAAFADLRCASGPEEAALEIAIALNVPFYAADRPAGVRLLSWLRTYGPQLRQGLLLDNVDVLLGAGKDEALEVARAAGVASRSISEPGPSAAGARQISGASQAGPTAAAGVATCSLREAHRVKQMQNAAGLDSSPRDVEDRRRSVLRLLRDVVHAAPGLQLVLVSGLGVTQELLQPCMPQDLSISFQSIGGMSQEAAQHLLRSALAICGAPGGDGNEAGTLLELQLDDIVQASSCQPGLLRMVARAVRCGTQDLATAATWAANALRRTEGGTTRALDAATATFTSQLLSHSLVHLPPDARAVLSCLVTLGCPLEEEDITAAAAFLGHPGIVRAGLCCLYDRGLLTFQDLNQRHDVVGQVRRWMLKCCGFMLGPAVHVASMAGASAAAVLGIRSVVPSVAGSEPVGAVAAPTSLGGTPYSSSGGSVSVGGGNGNGVGRRRVSSAGRSRRAARAGRGRSIGGTLSPVDEGRQGGGGHDAHTREKGIRLSVLLQHLDGVLSQVSELYANGCRVAALRVYNNGRALADRALLLVPAWISRTAPSSATATAFATVLSRHLNTICRHVLLPSQLERASLDLGDIVPWLPAAHNRLTGFVTAARAHVHLMALQPAARQLAAADALAQELYPALAARIEADGSAAQTRAQTTGGVAGNGAGGEAGPVKPIARVVSASVGGGQIGPGAQAKQKPLGFAGVSPQVAQLALAHAEMAAALKQYGAAARFLETFLELLAAAGMAHSLEGAQARMQLGDLCLRRNLPPAEAVAQYEIAATLLMQLYGQSHFRVGRAMLAAARCSPEGQPPSVPVVLSDGGGHGARLWGSRRAGGSPPPKAHRSLELQLKDCLYVQQLSQGKFNLDVAEVEVARGTLLCRHNQPDEALSCGLVALGIVLEILGDCTPQVAECLALLALALRLKNKPAAAAIMQHAHAVRLYAISACGACDADAAIIARPRPTQQVVLENLIDAAAAAQPPSPPRPHAVAAGASAAGDELPGLQGTEGVHTRSPKRQPFSPKGRTPRSRLRGGSLLQRSPVVQVPLPGCVDPDSNATPPPAGKSGGLPPHLTPSPMLVVLLPGEDAMEGDSDGLSSDKAQSTPGSPAVRQDLASRMLEAAASASGGLVRHVSYPPPLAPADSVPGGYDGASPSPRAIASDAEWPPARSATASPFARGVNDSGSVAISPFAGSNAAAAAAAGTVTSAPVSPTGGLAVEEASIVEQVGLQLERGVVDPQGSFPAPPSPVARMVSVVPSEMWADAPEDFADAAGVELQVAPASEPDTEEPAMATVAAAAAAETTSELCTPRPAEDQDDPLASARTAATTPGGYGMQLPFPPPPATAAAGSAGASSRSSYPGGIAGATADPWSTPVRARMAEPAVPHLHPSPLMLAVPRYTSLGGDDVSDSPTPFSPGLSLPQPPRIATAGPSVGTATSLDVSAVAAAAAAAAAAATTTPSSDGTPGSGTPVAQLSWSNYSPTAARMEQDSRAFRGGIVFPTPSSTPGPSRLPHRAPWLSWATSAAADSSPDTSAARALRFPDATEMPDLLAAGVVATTSVRSGAAAAAAAADVVVTAAVTTEPSRQSTPSGGDAGAAEGREAVAEWTLAAAAAAASALLPTRGRALSSRDDESQPISFDGENVHEEEAKTVVAASPGHMSAAGNSPCLRDSPARPVMLSPDFSLHMVGKGGGAVAVQALNIAGSEGGAVQADPAVMAVAAKVLAAAKEEGATAEAEATAAASNSCRPGEPVEPERSDISSQGSVQSWASETDETFEPAVVAQVAAAEPAEVPHSPSAAAAMGGCAILDAIAGGNAKERPQTPILRSFFSVPAAAASAGLWEGSVRGGSSEGGAVACASSEGGAIARASPGLVAVEALPDVAYLIPAAAPQLDALGGGNPRAHTGSPQSSEEERSLAGSPQSAVAYAKAGNEAEVHGQGSPVSDAPSSATEATLSGRGSRSLAPACQAAGSPRLSLRSEAIEQAASLTAAIAEPQLDAAATDQEATAHPLEAVSRGSSETQSTGGWDATDAAAEVPAMSTYVVQHAYLAAEQQATEQLPAQAPAAAAGAIVSHGGASPEAGAAPDSASGPRACTAILDEIASVDMRDPWFICDVTSMAGLTGEGAGSHRPSRPLDKHKDDIVIAASAAADVGGPGPAVAAAGSATANAEVPQLVSPALHSDGADADLTRPPVAFFSIAAAVAAAAAAAGSPAASMAVGQGKHTGTPSSSPGAGAAGCDAHKTGGEEATSQSRAAASLGLALGADERSVSLRDPAVPDSVASPAAAVAAVGSPAAAGASVSEGSTSPGQQTAMLLPPTGVTLPSLVSIPSAEFTGLAPTASVKPSLLTPWPPEESPAALRAMSVTAVAPAEGGSIPALTPVQSGEFVGLQGTRCASLAVARATAPAEDEDESGARSPSTSPLHNSPQTSEDEPATTNAAPAAAGIRGAVHRSRLSPSSSTTSSSSSGVLISDSDPVTPVAASRTSTLSDIGADGTGGTGGSSAGGADAAPATPARSMSVQKRSRSAAARIPLPPFFTGPSSHASDRSSSRIPTPPPPTSAGPLVAPTTALTPAPTPRSFQSRLPPPPLSPGPVAGDGSGAEVPSVPKDPAAAAAWTLYSSPAFGVHDGANSPSTPRDGDVGPHDGAISSPAARHAGSYTAAYILRARQKSAAMAAWGASDAAGPSPVNVGFLPPSGAPTGPPLVPQGVKMHNPLFVSSNERRVRSLGGDVAAISSYAFEHDDEEAGPALHSGETLGHSSAGLRGSSRLGGTADSGGGNSNQGGHSESRFRRASSSGLHLQLPSSGAHSNRVASSRGAPSRSSVGAAEASGASRGPLSAAPSQLQPRREIPRPAGQGRGAGPVQSGTPARIRGGSAGSGASKGSPGTSNRSSFAGGTATSVGGSARGGSMGGRGGSPGMRRTSGSGVPFLSGITLQQPAWR